MTRFAVALLLALALTGCTASDQPSAAPSTPSTSAAPTETPTTARPAPRPPRGACYRLGYDAAVAPTAAHRPVPCARPHTAATFFVGTLDSVADGHLLAVDSDRVQEQVSTTCPQRLAGFVGGSVEQRRLSMLRAVWFTPTLAESDRGADWFRCDVIALAGDRALAPLEGTMAGVLDSEAGRDRYGMCGTAEPGTEGFRRVICSAEHSWRAVASVPFAAGQYPGVQQVRAAGEAPCEDAGRAAADDPLDFTWGYEWPTPDQWESGRTYGLCWAPD